MTVGVRTIRPVYRPTRDRWNGAGRGSADGEFGLFGGDEVPMHQMIHVDADAAVDVDGGVGDAVSRFGRPEGRGRDFHGGRGGLRTAARPACVKVRRRPLMSIIIGQALRDGLEAADRTVELFAGAGVFGGQLGARSSTPSWKAV